MISACLTTQLSIVVALLIDWLRVRRVAYSGTGRVILRYSLRASRVERRELLWLAARVSNTPAAMHRRGAAPSASRTFNVSGRASPGGLPISALLCSVLLTYQRRFSSTIGMSICKGHNCDARIMEEDRSSEISSYQSQMTNVKLQMFT
jgi:hypothetical protein